MRNHVGQLTVAFGVEVNAVQRQLFFGRLVQLQSRRKQIDERRIRSAKPLAQAFNDMANRTEALVRTQRELLQAVSHELRTPLSRMRFAIDLIETAKTDAERRQRLDSLDMATEELDELVGELLSYVRMETTTPELDVEHVLLPDVLKFSCRPHQSGADHVLRLNPGMFIQAGLPPARE